MQYSNAGYAVAAAMVEAATDRSWESMIVADLWGPLGMKSAGFGFPAKGNVTTQPWGHLLNGTDYVPVEPDAPAYQMHDIVAPGGGGRMTLSDYGRFLQMHLQGLAGRDTLVKAETIRFLHAPIDNYAHGWLVPVKFPDEQRHVGSFNGFTAVVRVWPQRDIAVAVATNAQSATAGPALMDIAGTLKDLIESKP